MYYFYRCYFCGQYYYSNRIIKTKKCWKCNRTFQFKKSKKFSKNCSLQEAIKIAKLLKKSKKEELNLLQFIPKDKKHSTSQIFLKNKTI
ncbi:MAG: DUF1922 domain-containing protein [Promethearchaeota archaeon]